MTIWTITGGQAEGQHIAISHDQRHTCEDGTRYRGQQYKRMFVVKQWPQNHTKKSHYKGTVDIKYKLQDKPKWRWSMVTNSINYHCLLSQNIRDPHSVAIIDRRVFSQIGQHCINFQRILYQAYSQSVGFQHCLTKMQLSTIKDTTQSST